MRIQIRISLSKGGGVRGMRGERLSVREEGSGGGSELRSRFRSGSGSVENISDPDKRSGYFGYGCATLLANMRIFVS